MASDKKDHWNSNDYQNSASFVPKLAGKITQWLDLQKDDVLLDVGCGDGILDLEFSKILAQGRGSLRGVDSSAAMIQSAQDRCRKCSNCTFEVLDANKLGSSPAPQEGTYTKAFSNAAMHWILGATSPAGHASFFRSIHAALKPNGIFAFETGGLGNVAEMRTAIFMAVARHVGIDAAFAANPWFFPDEAWVRSMLECAGFRVDKVEREWRPTTADEAGVDGWVRLMGREILEVVPEGEAREAATREAVDVLARVCRKPDGGEMLSYVRLRCLATKI